MATSLHLFFVPVEPQKGFMNFSESVQWIGIGNENPADSKKNE